MLTEPLAEPTATKPSPLVLRGIRVRNLRSLYDVQFVPIQPDLTVFTGENDGGKTATLDAIGVLLHSDALQPADRSQGATEQDPVEVEGLFYSLDDRKEQRPIRIRGRWEPGGRAVREIVDRIHAGLGPLCQDG